MNEQPFLLSSRTGTQAETMIVAVHGPLTLPNIFAFQEKLAFLKTHLLISLLILDLVDTPYIDSAGLGCVINLYVAAEKREQRFALAGANERVKALLETAKVHNLIANYASVELAEAGSARK